MHNLFLGTSKRILEKVWLENGLLSRTDLENIQARVDQFVITRGVGRIPAKLVQNLTPTLWLKLPYYASIMLDACLKLKC